MRISPILSVYLGRQFFSSIAVVFIGLLGLIFLIEAIELLRRASGKEAATFWIIAQMGLLKAPLTAQKILPLACLFGGMTALGRLTKSQELVIARAAGISVWQFLMPGLILAFIIGSVTITAYNPIASAMYAKFQQMEAKYLKGKSSLMAVSENGLWLRQADTFGQSVVYAQQVAAESMSLENVIFWFYDDNDHFTQRIDASKANLKNGYWDIEGAIISKPDQDSKRLDRMAIETSLTGDQIKEGFATPESMSFWEIPSFIATLEKAGFSAIKHRLYWHSVLAVPLLLCAMVLLSAIFSMRVTRRGGVSYMIGAGVMVGFILYVATDVVYALGMSGSIPPALAAWVPSGVTALLGLSTLLHFEEG